MEPKLKCFFTEIQNERNTFFHIELEKIFANYAFNKGLTSRVCKTLNKQKLNFIKSRQRT